MKNLAPLWLVLIGGLFLQGVFMAIAVEQRPRTEIETNYCSAFDSYCDPTETTEEGDDAGFAFAFFGAGIGGLMALVGVIGFGVGMGMQTVAAPNDASSHEPDGKPLAAPPPATTGAQSEVTTTGSSSEPGGLTDDATPKSP